jgi:TIGR00266 family protein
MKNKYVKIKKKNKGGFCMETKINGEELPYVVCKLNKGESVVTENGGMSWMDDGISMKTTTNGGIMKGLGRALAGESIFMNVYTAEKDDVEIAFASSFPGQILEFDLKEGETIIAQKRAFLCAEPTVDISMHFRKRIGAGFFGGEGFIMQKFQGPGKVFLELDGAIYKRELADGQKLKVDNGYVAVMTSGVDLNIETVKGVKNIVFGGEGLFLTTLKGPGTVWIQSMPISKLASMFYVGGNH